MAHRINFNVYRQGKTLQFDYNSPALDIKKVTRMRYVYETWVQNVLRRMGIKPFKVFFGDSGEAPTLKIIGYRQLFYKAQKVRAGVGAAFRSSQIAAQEDLIPLTGGKSHIVRPRFFKKAKMSNKLFPTKESKKISRALYAEKRPPVIIPSNHNLHLRRLSALEYSGDADCIALQSTDAISFFLAAAFDRIHSSDFSPRHDMTLDHLSRQLIRRDLTDVVTRSCMLHNALFEVNSTFMHRYVSTFERLACGLREMVERGEEFEVGPDFMEGLARCLNARALGDMVFARFVGYLRALGGGRAAARAGAGEFPYYFYQSVTYIHRLCMEGPDGTRANMAAALRSYYIVKLIKFLRLRGPFPGRDELLSLVAGFARVSVPPRGGGAALAHFITMMHSAGDRPPEEMIEELGAASAARLLLNANEAYSSAGREAENIFAASRRALQDPRVAKTAAGLGEFEAFDLEAEEKEEDIYIPPFVYANDLRAALQMPPAAAAVPSAGRAPAGHFSWPEFRERVKVAGEMMARTKLGGRLARDQEVRRFYSASFELLTNLSNYIKSRVKKLGDSREPHYFVSLVESLERTAWVVEDYRRNEHQFFEQGYSRRAVKTALLFSLREASSLRAPEFISSGAGARFGLPLAALLRVMSPKVEARAVGGHNIASFEPAYSFKVVSRANPRGAVAVFSMQHKKESSPALYAWSNAKKLDSEIGPVDLGSPIGPLLPIVAKYARVSRKFVGKAPKFLGEYKTVARRSACGMPRHYVPLMVSLIRAASRAPAAAVGGKSKLLPLSLDERNLLLRLRTEFYEVFGVYFDIEFYPLERVFQSDSRMHNFASRAAQHIRTYVSSKPTAITWLNEFIMIYYATIYTRSTTAIVRFMALRFKIEPNWGQPLGFMFSIIGSVNLKEFGIAGIRVSFHGRFGGHDRAFRWSKIWGANPCLRNGLLRGSYSSAQVLSKYGITHIHFWLTYYK